MGARPSSFRRGGGFLNQVDGVITDYEFTDVFPGGGQPRKGKGKEKEFRSLYVVLSARQDGAEEDVTTTLFAGSADDFEISDGGKTITPVEESFQLGANTGWGKFITSLVDSGFPESSLPEDEINYEAIIGTRVRFVQVVNEEATKKYGKRKAKSGKGEYNRTDLQVAQVYGLPGQHQAKPQGGNTKPNMSTSAVKSKPNGKGEPDLTDLADKTLLAILNESDGPLMKSKLPVKIAQKLGVKHPQREEVRKLIYSDDYLNGAQERGLVVYDQSSKQQTIALV